MKYLGVLDWVLFFSIMFLGDSMNGYRYDWKSLLLLALVLAYGSVKSYRPSTAQPNTVSVPILTTQTMLQLETSGSPVPESTPATVAYATRQDPSNEWSTYATQAASTLQQAMACAQAVVAVTPGVRAVVTANCVDNSPPHVTVITRQSDPSS